MRIRGLLVLSPSPSSSAGCSSIEPWVKPYDRENLADPIMAFTRAPDLAGLPRSRVRVARRFARRHRRRRRRLRL